MGLVSRWIATIVLRALAVLVDVGTVVGPIAARRAARNHSFVPFVVALFGVGACQVRRW
jgi:hypothetical protein